MTNPPAKKQGQKDYVQTVIRIPPEVNDEVREAAERHGRSMNAEIIARLQESPLDAISERLDRMERMLQLILDRD